MIMALINFGIYPIDIFPGAVQLLLYTFIPAVFIGSLPAVLLADFDSGRLGLLILAAAGLAVVVRLVFRWGLRRYESGNLVIVRG